jgi:hypothetical protein
MAKKSSPLTWLVVVCLMIIIGGAGFLLVTKLIPISIEEAGNVLPVMKITDKLTDAVFTPSDASVKLYDPKGCASIAQYWSAYPNIAMAFLDTLTETPDGEFTATKDQPVGAWRYGYITGTGYYTKGVFFQVPKARAGTTGESEALLVTVTPGTAATGDAADVAIYLRNGGATVDNTTNIAAGVTVLTLTIFATSAKGYGSEGYIDPTTGYFYEGGFIAFDLTTTTARAVITGGTGAWSKFTIGAHDYWIWVFGQVVNDAQVPDDGSYAITMTFDNQAAGADALDVGVYAYQRHELISSGSFGTSHIAKADNMLDIHLA